jgi:hypothetical protein
MSKLNLGRRRTALSRRQALAAAATVGVGLAAGGTALGIAEAHQSGADAGTLMVRVKSVSNGTIEVFTGTERIEIRDKDLANRLAEAAKKKG